MKAKINRELCLGCGACTVICPSIFELDEEGLVKVLVDPIPEGDEPEAQEAAEECPVTAIELE